jgi:hypothetical protein
MKNVTKIIYHFKSGRLLSIDTPKLDIAAQMSKGPHASVGVRASFVAPEDSVEYVSEES